MLNVSEKTGNGIILLKDSLKAMLHFKFVALFAFLIISINLFIFSLFIEFEYHRYGIHLFDHTTLTALFNLSFWQHFEHTFAIMIILIIASFITLCFKMCLSFIIINRFKNRSITVKELLLLLYNKIGELVRFSILKALKYVSFSLNMTYITSHIEYIHNILLNIPDEETQNYNSLSNPLLIPLLITQKLSIPDALIIAKKTLIQTFGTNSLPNFSLSNIISFFSVLVIIIITIMCHFIFDLHIIPILIICVLIISSFTSFIATVKLIFDSALYNYCNHEPSGPFTELQIKRLFKIQEDTNA